MASRETRRVRSKVGFNRFEGQTAFSDKRLQNGREFGISKVIGNRVEVRNLRNKPASMRFSQIAHKASLRHRRIDFECKSWQWSPSSSRAINAPVASTNGFPAKAQKGSREFVLVANRRIGTSPERTSEKYYNRPKTKIWGGRGDSNPQ